MTVKRKAIVAIDPGPTKSAWVVWDGKTILSSQITENEFVVSEIHANTPWVGLAPVLVVEMIASYGMPVGKEVFETCVWIGRFIETWGGDWKLVYRKDVKSHLCGSARAKDSNVRQALIDRLGPPGTKKKPGATYGMRGDLWQALAVAVTAYEVRL